MWFNPKLLGFSKNLLYMASTLAVLSFFYSQDFDAKTTLHLGQSRIAIPFTHLGVHLG